LTAASVLPGAMNELGRRGGIGSHHATRGANDTWLTPYQIISVLGVFDLDPCAAPSPRPWPTAKRHIELPEDGLSANWEGLRIYCNPPYGPETGTWLEKMARHRYGVALVFARTETIAWQRWVWPFAKAILFLDGRLNFRLPDGTDPRKNAGGPSALIAYSDFDASVLRSCGISGCLVTGMERVP
jgi:DNA N-6-adenine-methyltransferase (Dam)